VISPAPYITIIIFFKPYPGLTASRFTAKTYLKILKKYTKIKDKGKAPLDKYLMKGML
jgi:hypothetical protein